jgi:DNA/RNA endonuclease YhcR with UshA esterase domain
MQIRLRIVTLASVLLISTAAGAQENSKSVPQRSGGYDQAREVSLQGAVVSYTELSKASPGAHLVLQTSSGTVDVQLGNANRLKAAGLELKAGDSVRVIGENVDVMGSSVFAARILQKGSQAVLLRSVHGIPLAPARGPGSAAALTQEGAR